MPELELRGLTVRYGSVAALSRVNADLPAGRDHLRARRERLRASRRWCPCSRACARHDEGQLLLAGEPVHFRSPKQARAAGIATVWQDLAVAPLLSIWRNFFLGAEPTRGMWPLRRLDVERGPRDHRARRWRGSG